MPLRISSSIALLTLSVLIVTPLAAQGRGQSAAAPATVPSDLKPLLLPHRSEVRLVMVRYIQDRAQLAGNYAGQAGGRGGPGGRGGAAGGNSAVPVSSGRIARLKRFDLAWFEALQKLDTGRLSPEGRATLDSLRSLVQQNQEATDSEAVRYAAYAPLVPFRLPLVQLIESRLRLEDVNPQSAAGVLDQAITTIRNTRAALDSGLSATPEAAQMAAEAVDALRNNLAAWHGFYVDYDPLFTWWMAATWPELSARMIAYATFLRDTLPARNGSNSFRPSSSLIGPGALPRYPDVPDLNEIIALPQDEMMEITSRFFPRRTGGRGGVQPAVRDSAFYQGWLTALKSLDFDQLSRNAQVDYLYLREMATLGLSRVGKGLPTDAPRKADNSGIVGGAAGRDSLIRLLQDEMIPYTPEQLMVLADREFAWSENEMKKAARDLGFGDDWKAAMEKVKQTWVPPGEQPGLVRDLIFEAIDFLRSRDLVTVPSIAAESQRMTMLSARAQLTAPFFLGGSNIQVAYPVSEMSYPAKMQSLRGNNPYFSHAVAFHEMIPGHNLSWYVNSRYTGYRPSFPSTPFYTEGWALYWELMMWDKGFHATPEQKIGALYWRMHRAARIVFSLRFHMGEWSPQEAVDFLVDKVGHEYDNAKAEVVRSFNGSYAPLYQAGYLLGGIQLRGLRQELVETGRMSEKAFHDEILRQGNMPINLLRLALTPSRLSTDMPLKWEFYGPLPEK